MMMYGYGEEDPDVKKWGLDHLMEVSSAGSPSVFTRFDKDCSSVEYVSEGYCCVNGGGVNDVENDEVIARLLQEELSRLEMDEKRGVAFCQGCNDQKESVLSQDWGAACSSTRDESESDQEQGSSDDDDDDEEEDDRSCCPEMADESSLDGEVGKRINQMVPIRHVPKVNGELPSADEVTSDHQRLMDRLKLYDLVELKVSGDGNCQFRALSDQIYRSTDHHKLVREQVFHQLKAHSELYAAYVPMAYDEYLKKISTAGEWGDHVTLQAAADVFGVKIFVFTSFKDTCYIEILPCAQKSKRIIFLSFWAEVHYNSIYAEGELPAVESKKKKWWMLGS